MEGGDDGLERVTDHEEPKGVAVKGREFYGMEKKHHCKSMFCSCPLFYHFESQHGSVAIFQAAKVVVYRVVEPA